MIVGQHYFTCGGCVLPMITFSDIGVFQVCFTDLEVCCYQPYALDLVYAMMMWCLFTQTLGSAVISPTRKITISIQHENYPEQHSEEEYLCIQS